MHRQPAPRRAQHGDGLARLRARRRQRRWLAFCTNETSVYQNPTSLHGAVDIIAHVGDRIAGDWVCSVQEIRYTIFPLGHPDQPVVDNKLAVRFDMALDTYSGGPIDPLLVGLLYKQDAVCHTYGDYDDREFFHIVTNSDGDEVYQDADRWQAWDTTTLLDGQYVVRVNVRDAKGNTATTSQTVTTHQRQPARPRSTAPAADALALACAPNPGPAGTRASFRLPVAGPADPLGVRPRRPPPAPAGERGSPGRPARRRLGRPRRRRRALPRRHLSAAAGDRHAGVRTEKFALLR